MPATVAKISEFAPDDAIGVTALMSRTRRVSVTFSPPSPVTHFETSALTSRRTYRRRSSLSLVGYRFLICCCCGVVLGQDNVYIHLPRFDPAFVTALWRLMLSVSFHFPSPTSAQPSPELLQGEVCALTVHDHSKAIGFGGTNMATCINRRTVVRPPRREQPSCRNCARLRSLVSAGPCQIVHCHEVSDKPNALH